MIDFDAIDWETRLSNALRALAKTQEKFLQDYWNVNGYPKQYSFNRKDETPFPIDDYSCVYNDALVAKKTDEKEYYRPLIEALAPVRSILRTHPALASTLKMQHGTEAVRVGIGNGETFTGIAQLVAGLMARQYYRPDKKFLKTVQELNSLLSIFSRHKISPLSNDLDLGLDVDLFYGAKIAEKYDLGGGYFIAPFEEFRDYVEPNWFQDRAPDQVKARDLELFFGIVAPFRWKPEFQHVHAPIVDKRPRDVPLLFHRVAAEFAELLSVVLKSPITWVYDFPGAISKTSSQLLGQHHGVRSANAGEFVGKFHDPFRKQKAANPDDIRLAIDLFSRKSETNYPTIAPLLHRLADAQRTFGRFAKEDRILDLSIIFERFFSDETTYKKKLSQNVSSILGCSREDKVQIGEEITHFYKIRSAIVHGGKKKGDAELLLEIDRALENGFRHARSLLLNSIS
ncbi:MAG: hypothetical protein ABJQ71_01160 [Roseibium sp.]